MIEITRDDAIEFTRALAEEKGPEFAYEKVGDVCLYVRDGKPDCIVGQYLAAKGVPLERLQAADTENLGGGVAADTLIGRLKDEGVLTASSEANTYLNEVQRLQDRGIPWMVAVDEAERYSAATES